MKLLCLIPVFLLSYLNHSYASTVVTDPPFQEVLWDRNKPIETVGSWTNPPTVVICRDAPVKEEDVRKALSWWTARGHRFGSVIPDSIHYGCIFGSEDGYITIRLVSDSAYNEEYLATTSMRHDNQTREMVSASIKLKGAVRERVLEHEVGHAPGFLHYNDPGHLMHRELERGGWDDRWINLNLP